MEGRRLSSDRESRMRLTTRQRDLLSRVCQSGEYKGAPQDGPALRTLERKGLVSVRSEQLGAARRLYWTATVSGIAEDVHQRNRSNDGE